jgi:hypothetical protein
MHAEYVVLDVCEHCITPEELRPARRFPAAARFDRQMHDLTGRRSAAKQESPSETTAEPGKIARIRNFFTSAFRKPFKRCNSVRCGRPWSSVSTAAINRDRGQS